MSDLARGRGISTRAVATPNGHTNRGVFHEGRVANCRICTPDCRKTGPHAGHGRCPGIDFPHLRLVKE